jgi:CRISPR-associated protein Csm3
VWDNDNADELKQLLQQGIALIENDYLGGSGSRGYGQVKFGELNFVELSADNNWKA